MPKLERVTVTVTEEMTALLKRAVESGEYATTSEIIREAVRDWSDKHDRERQALDDLRALIEKAEKGPFYPAEEVFDELRDLVTREIRKQDKQAA
jgi:antitoxin ParD1/3/4